MRQYLDTARFIHSENIDKNDLILRNCVLSMLRVGQREKP